MEKIRSKNNPIIKEIRSLTKKKYRWKNKLFIIEGIKIVEEALDNNVKLKSILFSQSLLDTNQGMNLFERLKSHDHLMEVEHSIFKSISDTDNPQGILATVEFQTNDYKTLFDKKDIHLIYLDAVMDPGNLGTIIRCADAFNIYEIIMWK